MPFKKFKNSSAPRSTSESVAHESLLLKTVFFFLVGVRKEQSVIVNGKKGLDPSSLEHITQTSSSLIQQLLCSYWPLQYSTFVLFSSCTKEVWRHYSNSSKYGIFRVVSLLEYLSFVFQTKSLNHALLPVLIWTTIYSKSKRSQRIGRKVYLL